MAETSIEWTDRSVNPIRARNLETGSVGHYCEKPSTGCANCYAEEWNSRVRPVPNSDKLIGLGLAYAKKNRDKVEIFLDESKLQEVIKRRKPSKFFWCDMTDLFGEWVPDEMLDRCFAAMAMTPQHTHQVLTKRPERMAQYLVWKGHNIEAAERGDNCDCRQCAIVRPMAASLMARGISEPDAYAGPAFYVWKNWPLPNVWLGTSVENQQTADERIPHLLRVPAAVRFLSMEPLLGPIKLDPSWLPHRFNREPSCDHCEVCVGRDGWQNVRPDTHGPFIDWVIVGGESGPGARPCQVEWIRDIVRQCKAAGVKCFVKQLGAFVVDRNDAGFEAENETWAEGPDKGKPTNPKAWPTPVDVIHDLDGTRDGYQGAPVRVALIDRKGGDWSEWPDDLRVREFPEVARCASITTNAGSEPAEG